MANAFYKPGLKAFLDGGIDLLTDTIKVVLIDAADYTFSDAHDFLDDVAAGARIATATLASKTTTDGVFDAADVTFTSVTGDQFEAVIIYRDSGVEGTSELICYIDTGTGFPLTPDGGNIDLTFDSGANKIFKIG
jgi:hypothetical protein